MNTKNKDELLPCPFCGEKKELRIDHYDDGENILVNCLTCESSAWLDKWNTRTQDTPADTKALLKEMDDFIVKNPNLPHPIPMGIRPAKGDELVERIANLKEYFAGVQQIINSWEPIKTPYGDAHNFDRCLTKELLMKFQNFTEQALAALPSQPINNEHKE